MRQRNRMLMSFPAVIALLVLASCGDDHDGGHHSLVEKIEANSNPANSLVADSAWIANEGLLEVINDERPFYIHERTSQMTSFACTECHTIPLNELKSEDEESRAHWNIALIHADEHIMQCETCHNSTDLDVLISLADQPISFDESYTLCGQCHSKQLDDWKGGAHGKRIVGWEDNRVAQTCVGCHNPHQPAFEPRWPSRYNTQKVKERK